MDWRILIGITIVFWGAYTILLKKVASDLNANTSMFLFVLSYSLVVGLYAILQPGLTCRSLTQKAAFWPLAAGILCAVGGITFFKALPLAQGSALLPLVGLYVVISAIGCIVFFKEPVTIRLIAGMVSAGIAIVLLSK